MLNIGDLKRISKTGMRWLNFGRKLEFGKGSFLL